MRSWDASKYVRFGVVGIVALAVAVTIAAIVRSRPDSSPGATTRATVTSVGPIVLTASELKALAGQLNQVIYWNGSVEGGRYEVTRTTANYVYVRYLPPGVKAGERQRKYLVVATYPYEGALSALEAIADGEPLEVAGGKGGVAVVVPGKPTNVRVAFPGVDFQIEVYDPSPRRARAVATSAALAPVR